MGLWTEITDAGTQLIGSAANLVGGLTSGHKNYKLGKKQLEWEKKAQQITWNREDNAVQRRAADLRAAGMNRLLAAGSGAATSSPIHVDAPQYPDLSGIGNPLLEMNRISMASRKLKADISQTEAQTRLLNGQLRGVNKQNALVQRTLDWYNDHPDSAPNIPGMATTNAFSAGYDLLERTAGRFGRMVRDWRSNYDNLRSKGYSRFEAAGF